MIIERITFTVKVGCRDEFIELTKATVAEAGLTPRVCSHRFGSWETVIPDLEFENMDAHQKFWDGLDWGQPKAAEWLKREPHLLEPGTTHELLIVH